MPSRIAFGVVASFCPSSSSPASSSTQYQLDRSPKSRPIVSFFPEIFLLCFTLDEKQFSVRSDPRYVDIAGLL
jgi:hypothetical protein